MDGKTLPFPDPRRKLESGTDFVALSALASVLMEAPGKPQALPWLPSAARRRDLPLGTKAPLDLVRGQT